MEFRLPFAIMTDLNSLLASKASLKRVVERYRAKLALAQKELDEIEAVLSIVKKYGGDISDNVYMTPKTVGDMATELLKEYPEGLTSMEILHLIRERWMPELMRSSISPPLSRLKHMGIVELDGSIWRLAENAREINFAKSRNNSVHVALEVQQIAANSLQAIMQRQTEILSQMIQNSSVADKESLSQCSPEERISRSAELIREAYEKTINKGCEFDQIENKIEPCLRTPQFVNLTQAVAGSRNVSPTSSREIISGDNRNGEYRRKRAF